MIRFVCLCGHRFEKSANDAGLAAVCPKCGLLNDVAQIPPAQTPRARAIRAMLTLHAQQTAADRPEPAEPPKNIADILAALTEAPNLAVMFFVLIVHLLMAAGGLAMTIQLYMLAPILLALVIAALAHWGNVLDDIGIAERDELPRPFRDLGWREDFIAPFLGIATALALCYGPAIAILFTRLSTSNALSVAVALALVGTFFFPAILLTLVTSGSPVNLRPDRILGVIDAGGQRYLNVVLTFALALIPYGCALAAMVLKIMQLNGHDIPVPSWAVSPALSIPTLGIGIFMMHAYCWHLGLLYRAQNHDFPWVGRLHVRETPMPPVRRKSKYPNSGPIQMEPQDSPVPDAPQVHNNP